MVAGPGPAALSENLSARAPQRACDDYGWHETSVSLLYVCFVLQQPGVRRVVVRALYAHARRTVRGGASGKRPRCPASLRDKFAPDEGSHGSGGTKTNRNPTQNSPTRSNARLKHAWLFIFSKEEKEEYLPVFQTLLPVCLPTLLPLRDWHQYTIGVAPEKLSRGGTANMRHCCGT